MSAAERYGELADALMADGVVDAGSARDALATGIAIGAQISSAVASTAAVLSDALGFRVDPAKLLDAVVNGVGC